jgi:transposase
MKKSSAAPASASTITIGLDLGDRQSNFHILALDGETLRQGRVATTREDLAKFFGELAPARIVMEVGGHSPWVSRLAQSSGLETIVANPRKVALITQNERKNDRADAERLARLGRADPKLLSPIQHRGESSQADLSVHHARSLLVKTRTALINFVRGQVKSLGYRLSSCSTESFHRKVFDEIPTELGLALRPVVRTIGMITVRIDFFDAAIERTAKERYPETGVMRQVDSVGALIATRFALTIEDARRFEDSRQVGAFLGLTPRQQSSGKSNPELGITKAGDRDMRRLLVIAANRILGRGKDCDLRRFGMKIAARGGKNARKRAKVAVARKLAVLLHHLWRTGEVYDPFYMAKRRGEPVPT